MNIYKAGDELIGAVIAIGLSCAVLAGAPFLAGVVYLVLHVLWPRHGLCQSIAWWVADRR